MSGIALGEGLNLKVLNLDPLTLGHAESAIKATLATGVVPQLTATATGAGRLLSDSVVSTVAPKGADSTDLGTQKCAVALPILNPSGSLHLLNVSVACGSSTASVANGLPQATALGHVLDVRVPGDGILGSLLNDVGGTVAGLAGGLLSDGVGTSSTETLPLLGGLLSTNQLTNALPIVKDLLNTVSNTASSLVPDPVVVTLGASTSSVKTEANRIISTAKGRGAEVTVLPLPAFPNGLAQVIVGDATATAIYDRGTGAATSTFDPALLRISVLGINIPVVPNLDITILQGTVLESTIKVGAGTSIVSDDKSKAGAVADGVSLHLLKGLGATPGKLDGGIKLSLAHAEASVGGKIATLKDAPIVNAVELTRQLPRTGPPTPLLPIAGVGVLSLAFFGRRMSLRNR
ncbi:MAG TPA: hypothetical protein VFB78_03420 [Acidimicrobiales bacterium]|nr:hypothetical protein [Acidimicrobiales bacterium]